MKLKAQHYAAIAAIIAAGCSILPAVGPDYKRPEYEFPDVALPDAGMPTTNHTETGEWKAAVDDEDTRIAISTNTIYEWWMRFEDAELVNLVNAAVSNNLSFQSIQYSREASRWMLLGSYAAFLPHINGAGSATRREDWPHTTANGGQDVIHRDVFRGGFDASWEIDVFGGRVRATEEAWAQYEAAGWSVSDAWVSLTAEVGMEYINLRTTQQLLEVARHNLGLQRETYDILKSRLDSGIGDELAVNQSKYIVDQTLARIPQLLTDEEKYKNAIAILAGDMPGARHAELAELPKRDWTLPPEKFADVPLNMIRNRPDVRVAERKLAAQVAKVGVAKSVWFPKLYINGTLGLESVGVRKFMEKDSFYGSIGPSISWPIFQGGSIYASVKAEEARMEAAFLEYESSLQNAYREVRDGYASYTQQYHRYLALEGAVKAASDAVNISNDLYKNGLRDFTAVIDAQRSLLNLEEQLVVSRGQITINLIALYKALGGGLVVDNDQDI